MIQLSDATFIVNDEAIATIPNSIAFTEGLGEQSIKAASVGGGEVEQIFSNDLESNFAMVKCELPSTPENITLARKWKKDRNNNTVQIIGETTEGNFTKTFSRAALTADYEVGIGNDATIPIEFKSSPAS
jgi:hypothetical protein